jgi:hypothetical protein
MNALLTKVQTVTTALIGSTVFDDPAGGTHALRYSLGALPDKRDNVSQGEDFPFCLISPGKFTCGREGRNHTIEIVFGLYTSGDKTAGLAIVNTVIGIMALATREVFTPYKLMGELSGTIDIDRHPYYALTFSGEFRRAR